MRSLLDEIKDKHSWRRASSDAAAQLAQFEQNANVSLPDDMRTFYRQFAEARLFDDIYRLMPVQEFRTAGNALFGETWSKSGPALWFAFCEMQDGDYVAIDLTVRSTDDRHILDLDHRNPSETNIIASSFSQFLDRALHSGPEPYYLGAGHSWAVIRVDYFDQ